MVLLRLSHDFAPVLQRRLCGHVTRNVSHSVGHEELTWHSSKAKLLSSDPGPVLVATGKFHLAKAYSSFASHAEFFQCISAHQEQGTWHNLHEVMNEHGTRSLYFDLDGRPEYKQVHKLIINVLQQYVRWIFCGDRLNWRPEDPAPVVLRSSEPSKYSCHVVFPQIQFDDHEQQSAYLKVLMSLLPAAQVQLACGSTVPILKEVVDCAPYHKFQTFRGPFACKLKNGIFLKTSQLIPESYFQGDPLSCFASRTEANYRLTTPKPDRLLEWNEEARKMSEMRGGFRSEQREGFSSMVDELLLFDSGFQNVGEAAALDFAGYFPVDFYERALKLLHPDRASQWWTWFRVCGVTYSLLDAHGHDATLRQRIWKAHHQWAGTFHRYSFAENEMIVLKCAGKRVSGLALLRRLVRFDNPDVRIRMSLDKPFETYSDFRS